MRTTDFVIGMLFEPQAPLSDARSFIDLANFLSTFYKASYTDIWYGLADRAKGKYATKNYRYKPRNVERLLALDSEALDGIAFDSLKGNRDFMDPNLSVGAFLPLPPDCPGEMRIVVDSVRMAGRASIDDLVAVSRQLDTLAYPLVSGIAFFMEQEKYPKFFVRGIGTPELAVEERTIAHSLNPGIRQYRTEIWDVFLHNLLRKGLLDGRMLNEVRHVVGDANVREVGRFYIISLPVKDVEYLGDPEKTSYYKNQLRSLFQARDMIMFRENEGGDPFGDDL